MFDMLIVIVFWEERLGGQEPPQRESLEVVEHNHKSHKHGLCGWHSQKDVF